MDNYDKLMDSLEKEMNVFEDSYKSMSKTQIYNDWYIIGFYTEYYEMLTSGFVNDNELSDEELNWLASKENPLRYLYDKWMSCEGSFSHNWDHMLGWMRDVCREEMEQTVELSQSIVAEFRKKTEECFNKINGLSPAVIEAWAKEHVLNVIAENDAEIELVDVLVFGSRCRGLEKEGSDLDIVVEFKSDSWREDSFFNLLNEDRFYIGDVPVDFNPITEGKSGSLEEFLPKAEAYLAAKMCEVPKDKIMIAVLDDTIMDYSKIGYPAEYTGDNLKAQYFFDTPEEFIKKWQEIDEGDWYWVFANGDVICSGAVDPGDIEIFEEHFCMSFEDLELDEECETDCRFFVYDKTDDVVSDSFRCEEDAIEFALENDFPTVKRHNYYIDNGKHYPDGDPVVAWNGGKTVNISIDEQIRIAKSNLENANNVDKPVNISKSEQNII